MQRLAWGNPLCQQELECHRANGTIASGYKPVPPQTASGHHLLHQQQNPKGLGCQRADPRFATSPLSSKHLIKELNAAVNSEAKKESKHELSGEAGEHGRERKSNARDIGG